jgi:hypothetical protein
MKKSKMKITKKIKKSIKKDPLELTEREFHILVGLAENEIQEWSMFLCNLITQYEKATKTITKSGEGVAKNIKAKRLGKKV